MHRLILLVLLIPTVSFCGTTDKASKVTFEQVRLLLGGKALSVELAQTPEQRERGLMFREELKDGKGMLFVFPQQRVLSFWMKNTLVPLSIGYFTKDKTLVQVLDMVPESPMIMDSQLKKYPSQRPVKFALEVPKGWFKRNKVKLGTKFQLLK